MVMLPTCKGPIPHFACDDGPIRIAVPCCQRIVQAECVQMDSLVEASHIGANL